MKDRPVEMKKILRGRGGVAGSFSKNVGQIG